MSAQAPAARLRGGGVVESAVVLLPLALCVGLVTRVGPGLGVGVLAVAVGLVVPVVATAALVRRRPATVSPPDVVTLARVALTGVVATATVLVLAGQLPARTWAVALVVGAALLLDAVDGWLARATGTASAAGARLDMESDAALLLVLSALVGATLGWWVVAVGAMRYVFVLASWVRPALRAELRPSLARRTVAAVQGIALWVALVPVVPPAWAAGGVALALVALAASFVRDVVDLETRG
ncbi:CDP-alcohol phosphatidyltransferase [Serinicoccus chungangensis]|uniref:CDP-alcohol phosphatidyltransferase n=1 Tax=Serinicoccus chungangensis TaxID=767452 RepID=A0A0W8IBC2_9MICO|nr:CDP-alcohol phosphatidyltransferase family protein [Serinicoccus chungangensis]KUG57229.1 CDP-alcohol phosphatidyltransferase [Serinicoccus chungangensis]